MHKSGIELKLILVIFQETKKATCIELKLHIEFDPDQSNLSVEK